MDELDEAEFKTLTEELDTLRFEHTALEQSVYDYIKDAAEARGEALMWREHCKKIVVKYNELKTQLEEEIPF